MWTENTQKQACSTLPLRVEQRWSKVAQLKGRKCCSTTHRPLKGVVVERGIEKGSIQGGAKMVEQMTETSTSVERGSA